MPSKISKSCSRSAAKCSSCPQGLRLLDVGDLHAELAAGFENAGHELPDKPVLKPVYAGSRWAIPGDDSSCVIKLEQGKLNVYSDAPTRRVVDSDRIRTLSRPTFRHYVRGVRGFNFLLFLQNTLFIALFAVSGTILSCSWIAFGFSILQWP